MTITQEQLADLRPGDFVWLPGHYFKFRVDRVDFNPEPNWRNVNGTTKVVAHKVVLPHTIDPMGKVEVVGVEVYLDPERLALGTPFYNSNLGDLENEVLDGIHYDGEYLGARRWAYDQSPKAILVWERTYTKHRLGGARTKTIEFGPCRWANPVSPPPGVEKDDEGKILSCPEFWELQDEFSVNTSAGFAVVRRSDIVAVRHIDAMGWGEISKETYLRYGH